MTNVHNIYRCITLDSTFFSEIQSLILAQSLSDNPGLVIWSESTKNSEIERWQESKGDDRNME